MKGTSLRKLQVQDKEACERVRVGVPHIPTHL